MENSDWAIIYSTCPELKQYSRATLLKVARELRVLPSPSAARRLIKDYGQLRKACRLIKTRSNWRDRAFQVQGV